MVNEKIKTQTEQDEHKKHINEMLYHWMPHIRSVARSIAKKYPDIDPQDLEYEAEEPFLKTVLDFDHDFVPKEGQKKPTFKTLFTRNLEGHFHNHIKERPENSYYTYHDKKGKQIEQANKDAQPLEVPKVQESVAPHPEEPKISNKTIDYAALARAKKGQS